MPQQPLYSEVMAREQYRRAWRAVRIRAQNAAHFDEEVARARFQQDTLDLDPIIVGKAVMAWMERTFANTLKADEARRIMESHLGGITRNRGECLRVSDREAITTLYRWGYRWTGTHWHDQALWDSVRAMERDLDIPPGTLPTRFIWSDEPF